MQKDPIIGVFFIAFLRLGDQFFWCVADIWVAGVLVKDWHNAVGDVLRCLRQE